MSSLYDVAWTQPPSRPASFAGLSIPGRPRRQWTSRHRAATPAQALQLAIQRHWGRHAGWHVDSGLGPSYGQIVTPSETGGSHCLTDRCRLDVIEVSTGRDLTARAVAGVMP